MTQAGLALVLTTIVTAAVHTLIPDHWLPFVLVSRAGKWTVRRTVTLTAFSAALHVVVSISLGLALVTAGLGAEKALTGLAEKLESASGWLLVGFGLTYMIWFLARGGHVHSFGIHPHHTPEEPPPDTSVVQRSHLTGVTLALIVGFNPCILVLPCVYGAAQISTLTLVAVAAAFGVSTITTMVVVTLVGLHGTSRLTSPFLTRYGEALSGGLIALTGLVILLAEFG